MAGTARRAGLIVHRFGFRADKFERLLTAYADLTGDFAVRPTLPITAVALARNPAAVRRSLERGVEFAIHGLYHNDHRTLGFEEQAKSISEAAAIFRSVGVPFSGFRAPYLRANQSTYRAVRANGLLYDSSPSVIFDTGIVIRPEDQEGYRRALSFYGSQTPDVAVRPRQLEGLVSIPVSLPDDEIMVDRLRLDDAQQSSAWRALLKLTYDRGDMFTVQLHPERVLDTGGALRALLSEARQLQPAVWIASLDEVAKWWIARAGASMKVSEPEPGVFDVTLSGPDELGLQIAGTAPDARADRGPDGGAIHSKRVRLTSTRRPTVAVPHDAPGSLLTFLTEEGYAAELAPPESRHGAHLDIHDANWTEQGVLAALGTSAGPLVRYGRWPSGAQCALAVTGDIDAMTLGDFARRYVETVGRARVRVPRARGA